MELMYNIISSSSKGNCYIYNQDLMIDIGVAFAKIKPYINNIKLLCITHIHSDHLNKKTIKKMIYEKPTIKIVCGKWLVEILVNLGINKKNIFVFELNKKYDLGKYVIELVPAIHDVENCGYKIVIKENNYKIFHITDTNSVDHIQAKNYDLYLVENNYQEDILKEHLKKAIEENDENKTYYLQRTLKTHLSKNDCDNFLVENMGQNSIYEYVHLSSYNNTKNGDLQI